MWFFKSLFRKVKPIQEDDYNAFMDTLELITKGAVSYGGDYSGISDSMYDFLTGSHNQRLPKAQISSR